MSYAISRGSALTQKMFGVGLTANAELATFMMKLFGDEKSGCPIRYMDHTGLKRGSSLEVNYWIPDDDVAPKGVHDKSVGQAQSTQEPLIDTVKMAYSKFDQEAENVIDTQGLVSWDVHETQMSTLTRRVSKIIERWPIRQLCGTTVYNTVPDYLQSWMNAGVEPDVNHWIRPDGTVVDGSTVTETTISASSANVVTGDTIKILEKRASSDSLGFTYPIVPANIPGVGNYYICLLSPDGFEQLLDNTSGNLIHELEQGVLEGGGNYFDHPDVKVRPVIIHDTVCVRHPLMPSGQTNSTTFRASVERGVFMGANALTCIYGESFTNGNHWGFAEHNELRQWTGMTDTVQGGKVAIVNSKRFASVVISHWSERTSTGG